MIALTTRIAVSEHPLRGTYVHLRPVGDSVQRALRVILIYAVVMTGEKESPETQQADSVTPAEMAAALDAVRASSPELNQAIDAAGVTPDSLASAHDAAARDQESSGPA